VAPRKIRRKWEKLRLPAVKIKCDQRTLSMCKDDDVWRGAAKLDGCYCLKTDLAASRASKETVHDRYKGLSEVEWAFRISKTITLEARPLYVRKESRTRGHLFVVMLAYLLVQELAKCWTQIDATVAEGIHALTTLCATQVTTKDAPVLHNIPTPRPSVKRFLDAAQVELPIHLASRGVAVSTRKTLVAERKTA